MVEGVSERIDSPTDRTRPRGTHRWSWLGTRIRGSAQYGPTAGPPSRAVIRRAQVASRWHSDA